MYHTVYVNDTVPAQVTYLSGTFTREERPDMTRGLLAPLYLDRDKGLMLFSHHPEGRVWQVSQKLTTTPLRGVFTGPSCPDSEQITWEWYNVTTPQVRHQSDSLCVNIVQWTVSNLVYFLTFLCFQGQQLYVKDQHIHVKCVSHKLGAY